MGAVFLQHGKPICFHSETLNGVVINFPTYDKELCIGTTCEKMETLVFGKRNYHSHRSSTIAILTITNKDTTSKALQMNFQGVIPTLFLAKPGVGRSQLGVFGCSRAIDAIHFSF
jgi:hypothetical protein